MSYKSKYKCDLCPYRYNSHVRYQDHYNNMHLDLKLYDCEICGKTFGSKDTLRNHHKNVHEENSVVHQCDICDYKAKTYSCLKIHNDAVHLLKREHQCLVCKKTFSSKQSSQNHWKVVHGDNAEIHECEFCQKTFKRKSRLNEHIKQVHEEIEKAHVCNLCEFKSHTSVGLKAHTNRVHLKIKNFSCEICSHQFYGKRALQNHISSIHAENVSKDFECDICGFKTHSKRNLMVHKKIHDKSLSFNCEFCSKSFAHKTNLQLHMKRMHVAKQQITCDNYLADQQIVNEFDAGGLK